MKIVQAPSPNFGPRKDGNDALYATNIATEIDADVSDEYWTQIRQPARNRAKAPSVQKTALSN